MEEKNQSSSSSFFSSESSIELADPPTLDAVYSALLTRLGLSEVHRDNLRQRGLPDVAIDRGGYATLPSTTQRPAIVGELVKQFGNALLSVPGFFASENRIALAGQAGLLIPVRGADGRIRAIKIRRDHVDGGEGKYASLTSSFAGGPSPGAPVHVPLGIPADAAELDRLYKSTVRITEGELKADVAFWRNAFPTISFPGIHNWRGVIEVLRAMGVKTVRLAFDMDLLSKAHVAKALDECAAGLLDADFAIEFERWPEQFKGIDDALAGGAELEVVGADEARVVIGKIVTTVTKSADLPHVLRGELYGEPKATVEEEDDETNYLPDWKEFPVDALPIVLGDMSVEYGRSICVHPAAMALFTLATCAGCIGTSRVIRLTPTWTEPAIVFGNLICEPSTRKSAALEASTEPAEEWNAAKLQEFEIADEQYKQELEQFLAITKAAENSAVAGKLRRPVEPIRRRLIVKDITVETFIREHFNNRRGLFMPCDELRMWFSSFGKYSKSGAGSDECFWLSVFNGRRFDYDRKTGDRTSIHIRRLMASIAGGVTPGCWRSLACQAMFDSGMIGRILLMWPPKVKYESYVAPRETTTRLYNQLIKELLNLDYELTLARDWTPREMIMTPTAAATWEPWLRGWRHRQYDSDGEKAALLGKIEAYCARFALIFAVCDRVLGGLHDIVEECHVKKAITLAEWFADEAERIYLYSDTHDSDAMAALQKVRERADRGLTGRELCHSNRRRWKTGKNASSVLKTLCGEKGKGPVVCRGGRFFLVKK